MFEISVKYRLNLLYLPFQPAIGEFYGFDHLHFWVGNAKQAASWYTSRMGFEYVAFKVSSIVIQESFRKGVFPLDCSDHNCDVIAFQ